MIRLGVFGRRRTSYDGGRRRLLEADTRRPGDRAIPDCVAPHETEQVPFDLRHESVHARIVHRTDTR